jgi:hypothetical protein
VAAPWQPLTAVGSGHSHGQCIALAAVCWLKARQSWQSGICPWPTGRRLFAPPTWAPRRETSLLNSTPPLRSGRERIGQALIAVREWVRAHTALAEKVVEMFRDRRPSRLCLGSARILLRTLTIHPGRFQGPPAARRKQFVLK